MLCPNCQAENRPGARFCISCGAPLPAEQVEQVPAPAVETTAWPYPPAETVAWPQPSVAPEAAYQAPPPPPAPVVSAAPSAIPVASRRFPVLRILSVVYKVLGIFVGGVFALLALASCILPIVGSAVMVGLSEELGVDLPLAGGGILTGIITGLVVLIFGALDAAFIYGAGELLSLFIAVEENTRLMATR